MQFEYSGLLEVYLNKKKSSRGTALFILWILPWVKEKFFDKRRSIKSNLRKYTREKQCVFYFQKEQYFLKKTADFSQKNTLWNFWGVVFYMAGYFLLFYSYFMYYFENQRIFSVSTVFVDEFLQYNTFKKERKLMYIFNTKC